MDIYELIKKRRSVRAFADTPVSDEVLNKLLEAMRFAPSAHNSQDYKFIVVKDKETKKDLAKAADGQKFIAEASVIIAIVSLNPDYMMDNEVPTFALDCAIAIDHLSLAAVQEDLGTCWICAFSQQEVREILGVPKKYKVAALMPVGVPYDDPGVKTRKKLKELVCEEKFSE